MITKKEFKQKCKAEKTKSYRYSFTGGVLAAIGCAIVFATLVLNQSIALFQYPLQLVCYGVGALAAIPGMVLDVLGEKMFKQEFKEYLNSRAEKDEQ